MNKTTNGDMRVIGKAKELAVFSFTISSNCDRYPKKYRHSLVDKIQIISMDIVLTLFEANRISNITDKRLRCEAITKAIAYCDELQFLIELSIELKLLALKTAAKWSGLVSDVKRMSIAWRTKERQ